MSTLRKISVVAAADRAIRDVFQPYIVGDVNDYQVKVARFGDEFDWHAHPEEDEAFLVMRGRIAIDFRDRTIELDEGDFLVVPRGIEHRPRSLTTEPIVLMFERASTVNTGNAPSERTVTELRRL